MKILLIGAEKERFAKDILFQLKDCLYFSNEFSCLKGSGEGITAIDLGEGRARSELLFDIILFKSEDFIPFPLKSVILEETVALFSSANKSAINTVRGSGIKCITVGESESDTITFSSRTATSLNVCLQRKISFRKRTFEPGEFKVGIPTDGDLSATLFGAALRLLCEK